MRLTGFLVGIVMLWAWPVPAQDTSLLRTWQDSSRTAVADSSRINYLRRISNYYMNSNVDSARIYCLRAVAFSKRIHWLKGEAQKLLNLAVALSNAARYDSAIRVNGDALAASIKAGDSNRIALVYINRGTALAEISDYNLALADFTEAMKICEATGNLERKARVAESLTAFYTLQENYKAGLPWAKMAYDLEKTMNDSVQLAISMLNLGSIFSKTDQSPEAERLLQRTIAISKRIDRPDLIVECALTLSEIYMQLKDPKRSLIYLEPALQSAHNLVMTDREAKVCINLGNALLQIHEAGKALQYFQKGAGLIGNDPTFTRLYYDCLAGIASAYASQGHFEEAYRQADRATFIKDSFLLKNQNERVSRLQAQFEMERREADILLLQKDKEVARLALQKEKTTKIALVITLFLLICLAGVLIARYRTVHRTRQIVQMEKLRHSISRDLHDDIGSTLSSIHINSKVALEQSGNMDLVRERLDKIQTNAGKMMQGMSDIVWAINPANDSLEMLLVKIREFSYEILETQNIAIHFKESLHPGTAIIGLEKRKEIFMIAKEAMNNAAKYSHADNVWINITTDKETFRMEVIDDGAGFDPAESTSGNGLKNMLARAERLNGQFRLTSRIGNGTQVAFTLPLP